MLLSSVRFKATESTSERQPRGSLPNNYTKNLSRAKEKSVLRALLVGCSQHRIARRFALKISGHKLH